MKQIIYAIMMSIFLAACASAPTPKQPNERNRVPVNKTVPDEIKNGQVQEMTGRGVL